MPFVSGLDLERNPDLLLMMEEDEGISSDDDRGEGPDESKHRTPTVQDAFHSMAEIASCSYEARKVLCQAPQLLLILRTKS